MPTNHLITSSLQSTKQYNHTIYIHNIILISDSMHFRDKKKTLLRKNDVVLDAG